MNTRELVLSHLQSLLSHGEKRLPIDSDARGILRTWMLAARNKSTNPVVPPAPTTPSALIEKQDNPSISPRPSSLGLLSVDEIYQSDNTQTSDQSMEEEIFFRVPNGPIEQRWNYFHTVLPRWEPLRQIPSLRPTIINGEGNRQASIMFIGDAPGFKDEQEGRPFMGAAGDKLNGMLSAMGLSREQIYLTHLVKQRPSLPRQTTNNRPPNEQEIAISSIILRTEIELVAPKVIVALGVIAARGILQLGAIPLAEYQAEPRFYHNIPVIITHHPSYLLRTSDLAERRALWEEMLAVMEMVQLPISDKQRGYFLPKSNS